MQRPLVILKEQHVHVCECTYIYGYILSAPPHFFFTGEPIDQIAALSSDILPGQVVVSEQLWEGLDSETFSDYGEPYGCGVRLRVCRELIDSPKLPPVLDPSDLPAFRDILLNSG